MTTQEELVRGEDLTFRYGQTVAVRNLSVSCRAGEVMAIVGASGSGKSTLLLCLAGILRPDEGRVWLGDRRLDTMSESDRSALRSSDIGVVFQFGNLVAELTAVENVALPLLFRGHSRREAERSALPWLERLGIPHLAGVRPHEMSGGEAQRVAVARAFVTEPLAVFADEPTGALDSTSADGVLAALRELARESSAAVVIVTHDVAVAGAADRVATMSDGIWSPA